MEKFLNQNQEGKKELPLNETIETDDNMGLDCSGQGECQPNIEPSDTNEMQTYLVRANHIKNTAKLKENRK